MVRAPERFGKWYTVYARFRRWSHSGVLERLFAGVTSVLIRVFRKMPRSNLLHLEQMHWNFGTTTETEKSPARKRENIKSRKLDFPNINRFCHINPVQIRLISANKRTGYVLKNFTLWKIRGNSTLSGRFSPMSRVFSFWPPCELFHFIDHIFYNLKLLEGVLRTAQQAKFRFVYFG